MGQQSQSQSQQQRPRALPADVVSGTFRSADKISEALRVASERFHLVSAGTSTAVPEGVAVAFSPILIDREAETYKIPGGGPNTPDKFGLAKVALDRIGAAAGISWEHAECKRVGDESHPWLVHYQAVGWVHNYDGSKRYYKAEKILDMRDGSAELETFVQVCASKIVREGKYAKPPVTLSMRDPKVLAQAKEKAEGQIRAVRVHILGHAESKAKNRVIRALGVRTSYTEADLAKPFVIVRAIFTGENRNPEIHRENMAGIRQAFLGGAASLGLAPNTPNAPTLPRSVHAPIDVMPVEESGEWDLDGDEEPKQPETKRERRDTPAGQTANQQPAPQSKPDDGAPAGDGPPPRETFQFGQAKGDPIVEAEDDQISWYIEALTKSSADPEKARFKAQNLADLSFCKRVVAQRSGEDDRF